MAISITEIVDCVMFGFLIIGIILIAFAESHPTGVEETTCYDRFGNEIQKLTCEEKIYPPYHGVGIIMALGAIFVLLIKMIRGMLSVEF